MITNNKVIFGVQNHLLPKCQTLHSSVFCFSGPLQKYRQLKAKSVCHHGCNTKLWKKGLIQQDGYLYDVSPAPCIDIKNWTVQKVRAYLNLITWVNHYGRSIRHNHFFCLGLVETWCIIVPWQDIYYIISRNVDIVKKCNFKEQNFEKENRDSFRIFWNSLLFWNGIFKIKMAQYWNVELAIVLGYPVEG